MGIFFTELASQTVIRFHTSFPLSYEAQPYFEPLSLQVFVWGQKPTCVCRRKKATLSWQFHHMADVWTGMGSEEKTLHHSWRSAIQYSAIMDCHTKKKKKKKVAMGEGESDFTQSIDFLPKILWLTHFILMGQLLMESAPMFYGQKKKKATEAAALGRFRWFSWRTFS